jgi:GNAT superfamily N-acetyltransferase
MNRSIELIPYDPAYESQTAQAYLEVFSTVSWNANLSLNDALVQLQADSQRDGFGGVLIRAQGTISGFSWWFDITGTELNERWRSRFAPRENIPYLDGRGVFVIEFGVKPALRGHGLGNRLLKATLEAIEPGHDWIALNTNKAAHAGLALLLSNGFVDLGLTGVQSPNRICMLKTIHR